MHGTGLFQMADNTVTTAAATAKIQPAGRVDLNDATTHDTSTMAPPTLATTAVRTASDCPGVTISVPRAPSPMPSATAAAAAHCARVVEPLKCSVGV